MIRTDSRKIEPGDIFVDLGNLNSERNIEDAISRGAAQVVTQSGTYPVETINVPDVRRYLENMLQDAYGCIVSQMTLIGVTGTNGKTTTCYLISQLLCSLGIKCAYIGTIGFYMGDENRSLPNTTVDIAELYELLLEANAKGYKHVALEASSQGLDIGRLNTIKFDVAAFTNLTEDHLDYHHTMENYAAAKKLLFEKLKSEGTAVINVDDGWADYFRPENRKTVTFGFGPSDYRMVDFEEKEATKLIYEHAGQMHKIKTKLLGRYNMYNLMTCFACVGALGTSAEEMDRLSFMLESPDGRMDRIQYKNAEIIIDYAHTPDAFEKILDEVRAFAGGKIYMVFGCTGDREREKRPVMVEIALSRCSRAILTVDDIHGEDPEQIFADMLAENKRTNYEVCINRKDAIRKAMTLLKEGDVLLILGKGHEKFIAADSGNIPHNDRQAVLDIIAEEE